MSASLPACAHCGDFTELAAELTKNYSACQACVDKLKAQQREAPISSGFLVLMLACSSIVVLRFAIAGPNASDFRRDICVAFFAFIFLSLSRVANHLLIGRYWTLPPTKRLLCCSMMLPSALVIGICFYQSNNLLLILFAYVALNLVNLLPILFDPLQRRKIIAENFSALAIFALVLFLLLCQHAGSNQAECIPTYDPTLEAWGEILSMLAGIKIIEIINLCLRNWLMPDPLYSVIDFQFTTKAS